MAYLIDTGVLLRLFDRSDQHHDDIRTAVGQLIRRRERLFTTAQNIAEFWNVSTRPQAARGGYGHPPSRVERRILAIERVCEVVSESQASFEAWKRLVIDHGIVGVAVHDARLAAVMNTRGIDHILTFDTSGFKRFPGIIVETPAQFA